MPDAEGPPVSNQPPFIRYGGQFQADAEILDTIADRLLKDGRGDLGENAESMAQRMRDVYADGLFGLIDPVISPFADEVSKDPDCMRSISISNNQVNRYLMVRDIMDKWRKYLTERPLASALMLDRNRLMRWITDLQSGMYVNCVYCGHRYGPYGEKPAQEALTEHVAECEHHPLAAANRKIAQLEATIRDHQNYKE